MATKESDAVPTANSGAKVGAAKNFSRTPSSWDPQDDLLLRHLKEQQKLGWKEIAAHFAHRTPNACQFRWRRLRSGVLKNSSSNPAIASAGITKKSGASTGISGALQGLNALSTGFRNGSPPVSQEGIPVSGSAGIPVAPSGSAGSGLLSNASAAKKSAAQWSFTTSIASAASNSSMNGSGFGSFAIGSPDDPMSNSISSLNSLDSNGSNKNSFNLYSQNSESLPIQGSGSFTQTTFHQGFVNDFWRPDEDELLLSKRRRELSLAELSILLPTRTEEDIISRIKELDQQQASMSLSRRGSKFGSATTSVYDEPNLGAGNSGNTNLIGNNNNNNSSNNTNGSVTPTGSSSNAVNGAGRALSRTFSASSQLSLNSNISNVSQQQQQLQQQQHSSSVPAPSAAASQQSQGSVSGVPNTLLVQSDASNSSSPLPSSKSSPLISTRQIPEISASTGGLNISSLRRTLSKDE